ncbi:MAG: hypothetical protein IPJ81_12000 [Chitinophagaceae bacterium]|nr:hypothetical protein [Chitinophagaceae bacterium]
MKSLKYFLLILGIAGIFISCQKELAFDLSGPSTGTLKSDDLGNCLPASVKGIYTVDSVLGSNNFIEITLNTGTPGTYNIKSDTINGYSFSGSGKINTIGLSTIKLQSSGIPLAAGTDIFTITYNNNTCKIPVNAVVYQSYFPLTQNSWWSYDVNIPAFPGDSLRVESNDNISINGKEYRIFQNGPNETVEDSAYYFKAGPEYYHRFDASDYTLSVSFDESVDTVMMFLSEALNPGTSWASEFDGKINTQPSKIRYTYTLVEANGNLDVNGVIFNNVHKVKLKTEAKIGNGQYVEDSNFEFFYAAGIGLIRAKGWLVANPNFVLQQDIRHYKVF